MAWVESDWSGQSQTQGVHGWCSAGWDAALCDATARAVLVKRNVVLPLGDVDEPAKVARAMLTMVPN